MSPQSDLGRRSVSTVPGGKPRTHRTKSKDMLDAEGYSSGDNGEGSVSSSRRSGTERVNAEISVDNIVEGGRRKRAFESSVSYESGYQSAQCSHPTGATSLCPTASPNERIHLLHLATAPKWSNRCRLAVCVQQPAELFLHPTIAVSPELREWRQLCPAQCEW